MPLNGIGKAAREACWEVSGSEKERVLFWMVIVQFEMPIQEEMSGNL